MVTVDTQKGGSMGEETRELMEEKLSNLLAKLDTLSGKERSEAVADIKLLAAALNEALQIEMEAFDKQEKRRIDEDKNRSFASLEAQKLQFDWKGAGVDIAKAILATLISIKAYSIFQRRVFDFEENGRLTSTASRELHLPRFWK